MKDREAIKKDKTERTEMFISNLSYDFGNFKNFASEIVRVNLILPEDCDYYLKEAELKTPFFRVIGLILISSVEYCKKKSLDPAGDEVEKISYDVCDFLASFDHVFAFESFSDLRKTKEELERHDIYEMLSMRYEIPIALKVDDYLRTNSLKRHYRDGLERLVADYLGAIYRSPELDSFMFKVLAEEEPMQFISEMAYDHTTQIQSKLIDKPLLSKAKRHFKVNNRLKEANLFLIATKGFFWNLLYVVILISGSILIGNDLLFAAAVVLSVCLYCFWIWTFIYVALEKRNSLKQNGEDEVTKTLNLVTVMKEFLNMMRSPGKISLDRLEEKLRVMEKEGAVMPETLHVFISDLRSKDIKAI